MVLSSKPMATLRALKVRARRVAARGRLRSTPQAGGQALLGIQPAPSSAVPPPGHPALNCELDTVKVRSVFGLTLRPWREALEDTIEDLNTASVHA